MDYGAVETVRTAENLLVQNVRGAYTEKYTYFDYVTQVDTGVYVPKLIVAGYFYGRLFKFHNNTEFCRFHIKILC